MRKFFTGLGLIIPLLVFLTALGYFFIPRLSWGSDSAVNFSVPAGKTTTLSFLLRNDGKISIPTNQLRIYFDFTQFGGVTAYYYPTGEQKSIVPGDTISLAVDVTVPKDAPSMVLHGVLDPWYKNARGSMSLPIIAPKLKFDVAVNADGKSIVAQGTQEDEEKIKSVYWALEKAMQTGSGDRLSLYDETYLSKFFGSQNDALRQKYATEGGLVRPSVKFGEPTRIIVRGNEAAIFGSETGGVESKQTFQAFRLKKQADDSWRVLFEQRGNMDAVVPTVFFPLKRGLFAQSGYPWDTIGYAGMATSTKEDGFPWRMKATYDETYLYVRLESSEKLPALGAEFQDALFDQFKPDFPLMGVSVAVKSNMAEKRGYFSAGNGERTMAKFGKDGKATENRYYSEYNVLVMDTENNHLLDSTATEGIFITFYESDNALLLAMPLELFGIAEGPLLPDRITLEEFNSAKKFLPYEVQRFEK